MSACRCTRVLCTSLLLTAFLSLPASAQEQSSDIPRLADGRPNLQGTWDYSTTIPLQRPLDRTDSLVAVPPSISRDWRLAPGANTEYSESVRPAFAPRPADRNRGYRRGPNRTSLITVPANGRMPPLTGQAIIRARVLREAAVMNLGVEARPPTERCLMGPNSGPPMIPGADGNLVQIVQTEEHIVIHNETLHSARIVKLREAQWLIPRKWEGNSIGRWEEDTLVIETADFAAITAFVHASAGMVLQEKLWRIDAATLGYEFTVSDPDTWAESWSAMFPLRLTDASIREHACHEENDELAQIMLSGRRLDVQEDAGRVPKP